MVAKTKKTAIEPKEPKKPTAKKKIVEPVVEPTKKKVSTRVTTPKTTTGSRKKKVEAQAEILEVSPPTTTAQTMLSYGVQSYLLTEGEEYMNEKQRLHFETLLSSWLAALLQGGDATISDLQESSEVPADLSDQASKEEEFALKLRKRDRERKLIKKIEESLQQIKTLDFGYCEECGVEIGIRRLEARPTATLCIDCKTIAEIKEKQQRS